MGSRNGVEEPLKQMAELSKTLKEGERILAPSRRPDGTLRKPIRIRAGYVPQEEVAIYQSKGALLRKEMTSHDVPPGYEPVGDSKPKTKSEKRNERKKEKRLQAACENGKNPKETVDGEHEKQEELPVRDIGHESESVKSITSQMKDFGVSSNVGLVPPSSDSTEPSDPNAPSLDIDKRIRALKKKIRLAEAQQQKTSPSEMNAEQLEKLSKLEGWRQDLKLLEEKKTESTSS